MVHWEMIWKIRKNGSKSKVQTRALTIYSPIKDRLYRLEGQILRIHSDENRLEIQTLPADQKAQDSTLYGDGLDLVGNRHPRRADRVSVQGVKSLGSHFACLCRDFDFYEVKTKKKYYYFSKRKGKYFYTFNHFYSEKSSKRAK